MNVPSPFTASSQEDFMKMPLTPNGFKPKLSDDPVSPPPFTLQSTECQEDFSFPEMNHWEKNANVKQLEQQMARFRLRSRSEDQDLTIIGFLCRNSEKDLSQSQGRPRSNQQNGKTGIKHFNA